MRKATLLFSVGVSIYIRSTQRTERHVCGMIAIKLQFIIERISSLITFILRVHSQNVWVFIFLFELYEAGASGRMWICESEFIV